MILLHQLEELPRIGAPVVVTLGFFDGVHLGHQHLFRRLREAAQECEARSLVVTFANSPKNYHLPHVGEFSPRWRYLTTAEEKVELIEQTGVDALLLLRYDESVACLTARQFFEQISARLPLAGICLGYDTSVGCDQLAGQAELAQLAQELGARLFYVERYSLELSGTGSRVHPDRPVPVKSSLARQLIAEGRLEDLAALLGRHYFVQGLVVAGKGKGGAELETPTANLVLPHEKITPPPGIYAGYAVVDGRYYAAAVCLVSLDRALDTVLERANGGPAYESQAGMVLEAHLVGYAGSLYGRPLRVSLLKRLRGWIDFESPEALMQQIQLDVRETLAACAEAGLEVEEADAAEA
jgi:riboflavin kinase/FMN adenylyltransferase